MHSLGCFPSEELIAIMKDFGKYAAINRDSYQIKPIFVRGQNFKYTCYINCFGWENPRFCDCCKDFFFGYGLSADTLNSCSVFSYEVCELCWAETVGLIILNSESN